jgi:hypothetical protein
MLLYLHVIQAVLLYYPTMVWLLIDIIFFLFSLWYHNIFKITSYSLRLFCDICVLVIFTVCLGLSPMYSVLGVWLVQLLCALAVVMFDSCVVYCSESHLSSMQGLFIMLILIIGQYVRVIAVFVLPIYMHPVASYLHM